MSAGKVVGIVFGSLILLIGVALLIGGGTLIGIDRGFTDDEGFLTSPSLTLTRGTYAIVGTMLLERDWIWWYREPAAVRFRVAGEGQVFLGIAPREALEAYLENASYAEIENLDSNDNWRRRAWTPKYRDHAGIAEPGTPLAQDFWRASSVDSGVHELIWEIEPGDWAFVVMNADASRGIDVHGTIAIEAPWLLGVGIGVLCAGLVIGAIGLGILLGVARGTRDTAVRKETDSTSVAPPVATSQPFPLHFEARLTEPLSPALWLVKWFLLIPHYIVLAFLGCGFVMSWVISLFAILFTGRYPRSLFDYNVGVMRWAWRVAFYSYEALGTDEYPPFTLKAGGYPADLDVSYPERLSPGLALVKWWLLAIPHYIVVGIFQGGAGFYQCGLVLILTIFAGVALLFTGRYPREIFEFVIGMNRWSFRVAVYAALMTDRYPPFRLES